jgi:hypothetical protein
MEKSRFTSAHAVLLLGDILMLGIVTLYGFASHEALGSAGAHMLTTFLPLVAAWFLISPHLKAYDLATVRDPRQLWRPLWSLFLAAPLMGLLRSLWLGSVIIPIFILVIAGVSGVAMLVWRSLFVFFMVRKGQIHG